MDGRIRSVRTFVRRAIVASLLGLIGLGTGDGWVRAADVGAAELPAIEQAGRASGAVVDPAAEAARGREAYARLIAERPAGAEERPLTVEMTEQDRAQLGRNEEGTRKLRVGTVKALNARIRFDDLHPSELRGRVAREHGVVQGTADGGLVWTAVVHSAGAAALRLRIDAFFLPPQAELWIYNARGETHGPYTAAGPEGTREFWTHTVSGSEAFLQLRKRGPLTARDLRQLAFVVADVAHIEDASLRGADGPEASSSDGFCSYNAACVVSGECATGSWDHVRNAVAHIQFVSGAFVYICSGGLVADANNTGTPYFLTANHCISRSSEASSMQAYFRFRSGSCGSTTGCTGAVTSPSTRGATILSTNRTSDYTLMRLSQAAPSGSAFLGWTTTPVASTNNAQLFRFSHPKGAPQAYSAHVVDTSKPTCTSWPRGAWIYSRDVHGATEGGSSGSPVVDGQGRIVGQLSGACGYNVSNVCDSANNATVDGAFANYYSSVSQYLGPGAPNQPPVASFVYTCDGLKCGFDASSSSDPDGTVSAYAWSFGDGSSGGGRTVSRTYTTDGTYVVSLTVTDNSGATASTSQSVVVSENEPPLSGIVLTATGYKEKGFQKARLSWSGATSPSVDVFRNDSRIATVANSGSYVDNLNQRGAGSYAYRVCEAGASTCSATATVTF